MKYLNYIILALATLIIVSAGIFFYRNYNKNSKVLTNLNQNRELTNTATTKPDQELTSVNVVAEAKKIKVAGSFQAIIELEEPEEVDGFVYKHRIAILDKDGSMTRLLLSNDEYDSLLKEVVDKGIMSGNYVNLYFDKGLFSIDKASY